MRLFSRILIILLILLSSIYSQNSETRQRKITPGISAGYLLLVNDNLNVYSEFSHGYNLEVFFPSKSFKNIEYIFGGFFSAGEDESYNDYGSGGARFTQTFETFSGGGLYSGLNYKLGWSSFGVSAKICLAYFSFAQSEQYLDENGETEGIKYMTSSFGTILSPGLYLKMGNLIINPAFVTMSATQKDSGAISSYGANITIGFNF